MLSSYMRKWVPNCGTNRNGEGLHSLCKVFNFIGYEANKVRAVTTRSMCYPALFLHTFSDMSRQNLQLICLESCARKVYTLHASDVVKIQTWHLGMNHNPLRTKVKFWSTITCSLVLMVTLFWEYSVPSLQEFLMKVWTNSILIRNVPSWNVYESI